MNASKFPEETYLFAKKFMQAFIFSLFYPYKFFVTDKYNDFKIEQKLYLYISLFVSLLGFSIHRTYENNLSSTINKLSYHISGSNIIESFFYTIPAFVGLLLVIKISTFRSKNTGGLNFQYLMIITISNISLITSLSFFIQVINDNLFHKLADKEIMHYGRAIGMLFPFFSFVYIGFKTKQKHRMLIMSVVIYSITALMLNTTYQLYAAIYEEAQDFEIYSSAGFGRDRVNIKYKSITNDSILIYLDFLVTNNSDKNIILNKNPKLVISDFYYSESDKIATQAVNFLKFDSLKCDAINLDNAYLLMPKSTTVVQFFSKKIITDSLAMKLVVLNSLKYKTGFNIRVGFDNGKEAYRRQFCQVSFAGRDLSILNFKQDSIFKTQLNKVMNYRNFYHL